MNKLYMHYLLKTNTNLGIKLKTFTSNSCLYTMKFIQKRAKSDVYLLLLPLVTNFMQLMPLRYNFYKRKKKNRLDI